MMLLISEVNFGDYGMLVNNIFDFGKQNKYTIFYYERKNITNFKQISDKYLNEYEIKNCEVKLKSNLNKKTIKPTIKRKIINKILSRLDIPRKGVLPYYLIPLELLDMVSNDDEIKKQVAKLDVLVVNGGGYFNDLWVNWYRKDDFYKIIIPILYAVEMKKRIFFTGNSYGPFDTSLEFFRTLFSSFQNVSFGVRDELLSSSYLRSIGVNDKNIKFLPDDLLILNDDIYNISNNYEVPKNKYIVIETYFSVSLMKKYESTIIDFLDMILNKYGYSIIFLPFQKNNGGFDQGLYFKQLSNNHSKFFLYDLDLKGIPEIQEVGSIISNAEFVVGTRYHTLVMALGAKTPVLNILKIVSGDFRYYYNKNLGILNTVFKNQIFNPKDFLFLDPEEAYKYIMNNLQTIIDNQTKLFNEKYLTNMNNLKEVRKSYFQQIMGN